jgi:very-long-chain (3R)-3-hydroxyacyl-CoA dehydratase
MIPHKQVQTSPIFSTMVFAWCIAEIVRYSTYVLALYNIKLYPLEWLRYTLFYVLYPLGAGSEAYLIYSSIPWAKYRYGKLGMQVTMVLFLIWPPGTPSSRCKRVRKADSHRGRQHY